MAIVQLEDGTIKANPVAIAQELAPLKIAIARRPIADSPELRELLSQDILELPEKQQVLQALNPEFEELKTQEGYQWRDLKVLHPGSPHLYPVFAQSDRCHIHTDEEALHVLAGECVFGFIRPDGSQMQLLVQAEESIQVPAGTEHWFYLTPSLNLKAVRYYTTVEGWIPHYTNRELKIKH
ncbi:MAG: acireductone dioxygenase [Actinomycetota bacterium]